MRHFGIALWAASFWLALAGVAAADEPRYGMADLDALATQHSWHELGAHLADIPPSGRDAHWQALAEEAAMGELTPYAQSGDFAEKLDLVNRYYTTFPSLRQSPEFLRLKAKIGLDAFARCFEIADRDGNPCLGPLKDFVRAEPVDADVVMAAAGIVARKVTEGAAASIYAIALPAGVSICDAPGLAAATVDALAFLPNTSEAKAGRELFERCFDPLKDAVLGAFAKESFRPAWFKNACPALMTHNALSGLRAQQCKDAVATTP